MLNLVFSHNSFRLSKNNNYNRFAGLLEVLSYYMSRITSIKASLVVLSIQHLTSPIPVYNAHW